MYFTGQSLILPRVQPLGPGMGGQGFETPCINRFWGNFHCIMCAPAPSVDAGCWHTNLHKVHELRPALTPDRNGIEWLQCNIAQTIQVWQFMCKSDRKECDTADSKYFSISHSDSTTFVTVFECPFVFCLIYFVWLCVSVSVQGLSKLPHPGPKISRPQ